MASRPPLGVALADLVGAPTPAAPPMSKGQMIAGIIADALAGAMGKPGQFAQAQERQQQQNQEQAQWGLHRQAQMDDWIKQQQYQSAHPDPSPMERDVQAWAAMTPEQRVQYQDMQKAKEGDPIVTITLPNGQMYSGPRSGLAAAMMGGGQMPQKPVGNLTPINGGPTASPSGGFPGY
jgi:hypothetical protein